MCVIELATEQGAACVEVGWDQLVALAVLVGVVAWIGFSLWRSILEDGR